MVTPTDWNSPSTDTEPALSADGRLLAFVSDRPAADSRQAGTRNIYLYDRVAQRLLPTPGLNSPGQEQSPSISPDGRFLVFVSERLDGAGERDIYLYLVIELSFGISNDRDSKDSPSEISPDIDIPIPAISQHDITDLDRREAYPEGIIAPRPEHIYNSFGSLEVAK